MMAGLLEQIKVSEINQTSGSLFYFDISNLIELTLNPSQLVTAPAHGFS